VQAVAAHIAAEQVMQAQAPRAAPGTARRVELARRRVPVALKSERRSQFLTLPVNTKWSQDHCSHFQWRIRVTKQTTPHTQTAQNTKFEQTDLEPDQQEQETGSGNAEDMYSRMEGAETGADRSPRKLQPGASRHTTEPEQVAHEGELSTRTPKRPAQGITSRSAEEESERQEKVVNDRPDAQAGLNHSK
jgi:hypothetical protein